MQVRRRVAAALLFIGLVGTVSAPRLLRPTHGFTKEAFEQIEVGATASTVEAALGRAGDDAGPGTYVITDAGGCLKAVEARRFVRTPLGAEADTVQRWWLRDDGLIMVQFDAAGRTTRKAFYPVWAERRGFLTRVSDWLGF